MSERAARRSPADAAVVDSGVVRAEPSAPSKLGVVVEGACAAPRVFAVGSARAWAIAGSAYVLGQEGVTQLAGSRIYNDMTGRGVDTLASIERIGGADLAHAWIARMTESRSADSLWVTWRTAEGWKNTRPGSDHGFGGSLVEHPSGALWLTSTEMYAESRFEEYVAGEPVKKAKMPKLDMTGDEYGFMPDGELLSVGRTSGPKKLLKRWSPTHPVDDVLVARGAEADVLSLRGLYSTRSGRDPGIGAPSPIRTFRPRADYLERAREFALRRRELRILPCARDRGASRSHDGGRPRSEAAGAVARMECAE